MQQQTLTGIPEGGFRAPKLPVPPRPTEKDREVIDAAVMRLYPKVLRWLQQGDSDEGNTPEQEAQIKRELEGGLFKGYDGYQFTRYLERTQHWDSMDSDLVEILDEADVAEYQALEEITRTWVKTYGIEVPVFVGDTVKITGRWYKDRVGKVTNVNPATAKVQVLFDRYPGSESRSFNSEEVEKKTDVQPEGES